MNSLLTIVLPATGNLEDLQSLGNLPPFGSQQIAFAAALARQLTSAPAARQHPEIVSLGFWLRAANIARLQRTFEDSYCSRTHLPRGLVFHVAPSNVDTTFVYSWMLSLLMGNRNLVRLSTKSSNQAQVILKILESFFEIAEWQAIASRTLFVKYDYDDKISANLSSTCDMRVVWGGDQTVNTFRSYPLAPHAVELNFANKTSLCLLAAACVLKLDDNELSNLAKRFCNDAYWFGQMACSSPRLLCWLGDPLTSKEASRRFYEAVILELENRGTTIDVVDSVNKEVVADLWAIEVEGSRIDAPDPRVTRVELPKLDLPDGPHCGAGLFLENRIDTLADLLKHLSRKIQTVCYFGLEPDQLRSFVKSNLPAGIDRLVPVGSALDFDTVWDGFDLLSAFTREVAIR